MKLIAGFITLLFAFHIFAEDRVQAPEPVNFDAQLEEQIFLTTPETCAQLNKSQQDFYNSLSEAERKSFDEVLAAGLAAEEAEKTAKIRSGQKVDPEVEKRAADQNFFDILASTGLSPREIVVEFVKRDISNKCSVTANDLPASNSEKVDIEPTVRESLEYLRNYAPPKSACEADPALCGRDEETPKMSGEDWWAEFCAKHKLTSCS